LQLYATAVVVRLLTKTTSLHTVLVTCTVTVSLAATAGLDVAAVRSGPVETVPWRLAILEAVGEGVGMTGGGEETGEAEVVIGRRVVDERGCPPGWQSVRDQVVTILG
jgi:hypothetical protein